MGRRSKTRRPDAPPVAVPTAEPLPAQEGVAFETLQDGTADARRLFSYAGAWAPPSSAGGLAWGAWVDRNVEGGERQLVGAVLLERRGSTGMLDGPVVVVGSERLDPVEIAARLLRELLRQATALGIVTLFARPQGLDRIWVRFGFIPVPEVDLPSAFKTRPGTGLFAWRGGTALWSSRKPPGDPGAPF